ncbi:MAG: peptidoglycan DD-metalloendopeptidase family protein, partial [Armatimonadota bacterium]
ITQQLHAAETKLLAKRQALTGRLTEAYKNPPPTYVTAVIASRNGWDAMTRTKLIRRIVTSDVNLVAEIREIRQEIADRQQTQRHKVTQINGLQRTLSGKEAEEKQLATLKQAQLESIQEDREAYEKALDDLIAESNRIAARIRAMQSTPAGKKRYAKAFRGGFIRPVDGAVSSGFGMRFHPILRKYKRHTGVDLRCRTGTPVHAAASGMVIISGWMGAYGNAVVIDHGGGVSTLYGHNSRLACSAGQEVKQGQVISYSGSTGWSTGPHLHFEVRHSGSPINPL